MEIDPVTLNGGNQASVIKFNGTQTGPFKFGMPGVPDVPPTGRKVSVKDSFVLTFQGDKVAMQRIQSPADGGLPGILAQLGVKMPAM